MNPFQPMYFMPYFPMTMPTLTPLDSGSGSGTTNSGGNTGTTKSSLGPNLQPQGQQVMAMGLVWVPMLVPIGMPTVAANQPANGDNKGGTPSSLGTDDSGSGSGTTNTGGNTGGTKSSLGIN